MSTPTFRPEDYLDLSQTAHAALFEGVERVWDVLPRIEAYLRERLKPGCEGKKVGEAFIGPDVFIGAGTVVEPGAVIKGPAWIGANCEIRTGAYVRENVIVGDGVVLGNSCEFKNAILFNGCQVPHYSYVGDSVLGHRAHLGAGVILSNFKLAGDEIVIRADGAAIATGLHKFGAIVGDGVEIGCQAVLNPGSLIGRESVLYPATIWGGVLPARTVVKNRPEYVFQPRRF